MNGSQSRPEVVVTAMGASIQVASTRSYSA